MGFITAGYDGTVDEVQFAEVLHRYSVVGADDFTATTQAGDRIVAISDGVALGPGTRDVATDIPNIQFAVATGTRWDLVALRRDWQPPGGSSSIEIVQGGSAKGYPDVGTAATSWNRRPGIMDDQPLYLQEVNGTLLGQRIDLRCWASHGGLFAKDALVRTYLDRAGTEVNINGATWHLQIDNGVAGWVLETPPAAKVYSAADWVAGAIPLSTSPDGNNIWLARIAIPDPGFKYHVQVLARMEGGKATTRWDANVSIAGQPGYVAVAALGNTVAPWYDITGFTHNPITGASNVDLNLVRLSGTETFGLTAFNRAFRVMIIPAS